MPFAPAVSLRRASRKVADSVDEHIHIIYCCYTFTTIVHLKNLAHHTPHTYIHALYTSSMFMAPQAGETRNTRQLQAPADRSPTDKDASNKLQLLGSGEAGRRPAVVSGEEVGG